MRKKIDIDLMNKKLIMILRQLIADSGMTYRTLADKADMHRVSLSFIMLEKSEMRFSSLIKISNALGYKSSDILSLAENLKIKKLKKYEEEEEY